MTRSNVKILTVVGARPQFVKAAMVSRAIVLHNERGQGLPIVEDIVHTGQHYDPAMSQVFFDELGIPEPAVNLAVGSGSHAETTARMLEGIEREIVARRPDWVLLYGDTNSTLAGALAAAKLHVPVAHVEAGLRSFNRRMPEEINRVLTDHVSDLLFCPTKTAVENLTREGISRGVHHVGDVMYDAALTFGEIARRESNILEQLGLKAKGYYLATVHRAENTDDRGRLSGILEGLGELARQLPVVFPVHPRTRKCIQNQGLLADSDGIRMIEPVSFLDMIRLEQEAMVILTDSGGVQKEAYFHGVPCVTLRDETEWVETVEAGWNRIAGADGRTIAEASHASHRGRTITEYGDGRAACSILAGMGGLMLHAELRSVA
jgi:UDP-GlcNAc3NAcA epimerase